MFNLDQALAAIKNKPEFSVKDRGEFTVIDYVINNKDTFIGDTDEESHILLNLRGTTFDTESREIIRLGFHKFMNYGENPSLDSELNFLDDHVITQKLDGSCIFPIYARSGTVLGTRAGVTDVSKLADDYLASLDHTRYQEFIKFCQLNESTPIFEFCSRANRVVIDHPETKLVLTGIRYMNSGTYVFRKSVAYMADLYAIPVVSAIRSTTNDQFATFRDGVNELLDDEGVVIIFESGNLAGHMIKLKAADYVLKHKALDQLRFEKDVLLLALGGLMDDVYPLLDNTTRDRVESHVNAFMGAFHNTLSLIGDEFDKVSHILDRKSFALAIAESKYKQYFFKMHSGETKIFDMLLAQCKKMCATQASTKELKTFLDFQLEY
jgi:RNA ligase